MTELHGVVGDGMVMKARRVNQRDLPEEESSAGVRASIVVMKPL